MSEKPILEVRQLSKRFDGNGVLKNVSFAMAEGEVIVVVGPSGCGKSTLLRCINGLERPDGGGSYLMLLELADCAAVTSGSYQRYYEVDGVRYCHIVDPDTGEPARTYEMVTVICPDSGTADALSTALFLLPQEEGSRLARSFGAEALWYTGGSWMTTPGFPLPAA